MDKDRRQVQAKHLKRLLEDKQISQNKLAGKLRDANDGVNVLPQQRISAILKGEGLLQYYQAEAIQQLYPEYRIPWLLGIDQYATEEEFQEAESKRHENRSDMDSVEMNSLLIQLAYKAGYKLNTVYYASCVRGMEPPKVGGDFAKFSLRKGEDRVELSVDDITVIESELIKYSRFLFWEALNRKKESNDVEG